MKTSEILSPELLSDFKRQPQQPRPVLISCKGDLNQTQKTLEKQGIDVLEKMLELNILKANIDLNALLKLQQLSNIEYIEIDQEVRLD